MRFIVFGLIFLSSASYAQFGKMLKKATKKVAYKVKKEDVLDHAGKKLTSMREKFDTTSFTYSIALNDQAGQFENKEKLDEVATLGSMYLNKDKEKKPMDEARENLDIGEMAYASNGFRLAEISLLAATVILVDENQENHPMYSRAVADLGMLYNSMGRYAISEQFTREALDKREALRGHNSIDYAASLNNIGVLNKNLGNYNDAEKELSDALSLNKSLAGEESMPFAISLNNRAVLRQLLGRFDEAETDMQLALSVASKTLKKRTMSYIRLQSNLALLYQQQGKYSDAERIFQKSLDKIAADPLKSKKTNPDYAHMLENMASLYVVMGRESEAIALYEDARSVYMRKFGANYSGYGLVTAKLGVLYRRAGDSPKALNLLLNAHNIILRSFGEGHPNIAEIQIELALTHWKLGERADATSLFTQALDKSLEFVGTYFAPMSETEKASYWKTLMPSFEKFYSFVASSDSANPELLADCMNYRLATKALLLSSTTKVKNQILKSGDNRLIQDYKTWLDQKDLLAVYYSYSKEDLAEQKINLDSIKRAANQMEKSLSERSGLFSSAYRKEVPKLGQLQDHLKAGETAIEMIKIDVGLDKQEAQYLAIIITSTDIRKVTLLNGEELEGRQFKAYRNFIRIKRNNPYAYNSYWRPINNILKNSSKIYFSPDGIYNQVNINTLKDDTGEYIIENRNIATVTSLRDLLKKKDSEVSKNAVLIGNPLYGSGAVDPLPGTATEISMVDNLLSSMHYKTNVYMGESATETALKQAQSPGIMHIATHGFFVADPGASGGQVFSIPLNNVNENVLLRSGLLLAGVGLKQNNMDLSDSDDGVLTAYEVMNLDLEATDLVVLSACETGLGDVMAGEGVYGLQRAFMVAGSSAVVMSLWKVDDQATQQLMADFYKIFLNTKDMQQAFRTAQNNLRKKYAEPYYWGAFVLIGT